MCDDPFESPRVSLKKGFYNIDYLPEKIRDKQCFYSGKQFGSHILETEISKKQKSGDSKKPAHTKHGKMPGDDVCDQLIPPEIGGIYCKFIAWRFTVV